MSLTPRQQKFVEEYMLDLNATQAAIRAGYAAKDADVQGPRLLGNVGVSEAIAAAQAERSERTRIDADWLLGRLAAEATADLGALFDDSGSLRPIHEWPLIWRQGLVAGVEVEELYEGRGENREHIGRLHKVKLSDRVKRLELIGRHIGVQAFKDNINLSGAIGMPEIKLESDG